MSENCVNSNPITIIKRNVQDIAPVLRASINTLCWYCCEAGGCFGREGERKALIELQQLRSHTFFHLKDAFCEESKLWKIQIFTLTSGKALLQLTKVRYKSFHVNTLLAVSMPMSTWLYDFLPSLCQCAFSHDKIHRHNNSRKAAKAIKPSSFLMTKLFAEVGGKGQRMLGNRQKQITFQAFMI